MIGIVAPGARVVIRDAEWFVRKVDTTSTGGQSIHAVGLSELVKDREAIFLSELERDITILDPAATQLVPDASPRFRDALLYIESLMRQTPPTDPPSEENPTSATKPPWIGSATSSTRRFRRCSSLGNGF